MQDVLIVMSPDASLAGLIARTLRCRQFYCVLLPWNAGWEELNRLKPKGLILAANGEAPEAAVSLALSMRDTPVLAVGAMAAALCRALGGSAGEPRETRGAVTLSLDDSPLFRDVAGGEHVLHSLCDLTLPQGVARLASATERAIGFRSGALYALQYPVERNDPDAAQILCNFAEAICGCAADWDEDGIIRRAVDEIREAAGDGNVLCAVSGGVDSSVCAKLAQMAVGNRLVCVFVDTGLFRGGEPQDVIAAYNETMGVVAAYVDARESFLRALRGVGAAADKERIVSSLMEQVILKQLGFDPAIRCVVTGTNFNDTLYGQGRAAYKLEGARACEPVRDLFKDEVRRLAVALELPAFISGRQPFPASGLATRVLCDVTDERLALLRAADAIFLRELAQAGLDKKLWQGYATLAVNPDSPGTYAVILRALQAGQGCAYAARLPADLLERVTADILAQAPGVRRVVYDLTPSAHYVELE